MAILVILLLAMVAAVPQALGAAISSTECVQAFKGSPNLKAICFKPIIMKGCPSQVKANCKGLTAPSPSAPPPAETVAAVPDPAKDALMTQCCTAAGVPSACMQYCAYEVNNPQSMSCNPVCLGSMRVINACAANGADSTSCCTKAHIPDQCVSFCVGNMPAAPTMFSSSQVLTYKPCFDYGYDIMQCHKTNAPSTANWPAGLKYNGATTDQFPPNMVSAVKSYCAVQTGNLLGAASGGGLNNLVQGFGG